MENIPPVCLFLEKKNEKTNVENQNEEFHLGNKSFKIFILIKVQNSELTTFAK